MVPTRPEATIRTAISAVTGGRPSPTQPTRVGTTRTAVAVQTATEVASSGSRPVLTRTFHVTWSTPESRTRPTTTGSIARA